MGGNISHKKTEITDQKVHNILISKIGKKKEKKIEVFDFINVRGQQTFEENEINPIGIKIENNKIQNMLENYKKYPTRFNPDGMLFSSLIKITWKKYL